jgi:hypothetical protein
LFRLSKVLLELEKAHCRSEFMKRFHTYCSKAKGVLKKLPAEKRTREHLSTLIVRAGDGAVGRVGLATSRHGLVSRTRKLTGVTMNTFSTFMMRNRWMDGTPTWTPWSWAWTSYVST